MKKQTADDLKRIMRLVEDDVSMLSSLALYSHNNAELVVFFVDINSFLSLLNTENDSAETKKYFELAKFIHPDDADLFSYHLLSQDELGQLSFNFRIIRQDKIAIANAELERVNCDSANNTIAFKAKLHDAKSLLTGEILSRASMINFESMLQYTNDFIFFKDLHHVYTASSQTMADITGFSSGNEHVGLTDYDIFPKEHADNYYRMEKEIYRGRKAFIEDIQPFYDENGNEGWVNNHKYPIKDESGVIVGLFGVARIVTEEIFLKRKLEESQKELKHLANIDGLTSLINRRHGYELCQQVLAEATRYNTPLSLIIFDVDHFKSINDTYGHDSGDKVLSFIAKTGRSIIRKPDIFFRYGGEEFVICMPQTDLNGAVRVMERINDRFDLPESLCISSPLTVSAGVVVLESDESLDGLIQRADRLLYKAKSAGRNCIKY